MKQKTTIWTTLLTSVCCLLLYACTGAQEDLERLNAASQDVDSRTSKMVTAEVTLTETGTLQEKLIEKLGSDKSTTVQDLKISGPLKGKDVEFLHELKSLEKLDMTNIEINTNWSDSYTISYSQYGNPNETVSAWLVENQISNYMFVGMTSLKEVLIPETITSISYSAFRDCTSLTSVTLPNILTEIGGEVFYNCTSLASITLPATLNNISYSAFYNTAITSLVVPEGITSISGFNNCPKLKAVTLPSTLKNIGSSAFSYCTSLENLTIPGNVERIEGYAFSSSALTKVDIPASVQTLGYGVFNDCDQLKILTIPATVTQVDGSQVSSCDNLQALVWETSITVQDSRPNEQCFLYINGSASYEPGYWSNVVIDGIAESIQLTYSNSVSNTQQAFCCPFPFKAKNISLTMSFNETWNARWTYEGRASGWRTIALPFKVTSITSELKGSLAPFCSDQEGTKPFWLRSLTADGFVDETSIKANKPYIIAMPYNPDIYLDEYNICGNVVFTGENVDVEATPNPLSADEGAEYFFQPTYQYVKKGNNVYALNYDYTIRNRDYGSVFANVSASIYPYEAYLMQKPGSETRALIEIDARPVNTRSAAQKNATGIPAIGDM